MAMIRHDHKLVIIGANQGSGERDFEIQQATFILVGNSVAPLQNFVLLALTVSGKRQ